MEESYKLCQMLIWWSSMMMCVGGFHGFIRGTWNALQEHKTLPSLS